MAFCCRSYVSHFRHGRQPDGGNRHALPLSFDDGRASGCHVDASHYHSGKRRTRHITELMPPLLRGLTMKSRPLAFVTSGMRDVAEPARFEAEMTLYRRSAT